MATLTTDRSYYFPLKPRIKFKSMDGTDTYLTFNAHGSPKEMNVIYADMEKAIGETGTFNIIVEDSDNVIAKDHLHNTKVYIELGKTEAELRHWQIGFADIIDINRPRTGYKEYRVSGFGSVIQAQELLLLIRQAGKGDKDAAFTVKKLFERCQTDRKFRPLNRDDIESLTGWKRNIASDLNTNYKVLNEVFSSVWDFYDRLAALEGANWYIDVSTGEEVLTVAHPIRQHTGRIIKSGDLRSPSDRADRVAYIKGEPFTITDDSSSAAGIKTRLYSTQVIEQEVIKENMVDKGRTTLNKRFIAQQVEIKNDQRRITDLVFNMERIGEPESPKSRVNGFVVMDEENKPTGTLLGRFYVDLGQLERDPDPIEVNDIDLKTRFLEGGSKIWIGFTDRSGIKGDVEDDKDNTVAWHHDNTVNTAHTAGTYSATAVATENDREDPSTADWVVSTNGPQYNFKILSTIKRLMARSNVTAAKLLRYKEGFIDSTWINTPAELNRFLALNLNPMSKTRRTIPSLRVTIPNNFVWEPYKYVTFSDGKSAISQDLQIARVGYFISALPGDPQYGTYTAEVTLNGSYNSLIGSCVCE